MTSNIYLKETLKSAYCMCTLHVHTKKVIYIVFPQRSAYQRPRAFPWIKMK